MIRFNRWIAGLPLAAAMLPTPEEMSELRNWAAAKFEKPDPPFSFTYDSKPSAELLKTWTLEQASKKLDEQRTEHRLNYTDPKTGLVIRCMAVEYHNFPTVEWTIYFKNTGKADTPTLEAVKALDLHLLQYTEREFVLHHHTGDNKSLVSYQPHRLEMAPRSEHVFAPGHGRPTTGAFPYFNIEWSGQGLIVVVGWPGQWVADFTRDDTNGLRICAGQQFLRLKLLPNEEIRSPLMVVQFWTGDRIRAQNIWRRWMITHNLPRPGGKLPPPTLAACSSGFFPGLRVNEAGEFQFIDGFAKEGIKLDYWWMDAGWYPCKQSWGEKRGTWEPDPERFPRGIKSVSDHAHAKGMKLILWFEPEHVNRGSWLYEKHPEWLLKLPASYGDFLLDLGNRQAREWLTDHIDKFITEQGVDLYRQDFNIGPLKYWRANDAPDRQGITEIHYVEGYLAYWDELRRRHPNMLIDSCASGGRRNDLETLRRAVPLLRSDYHGAQPFALGNQNHTYGISFWIPYFGEGVYGWDEYTMRSHMCPHFTLGFDVRDAHVDWAKVRRIADQWRKVSQYFFGDYYPLSPYSVEETVWMAWQFDRADLGEGMIEAFRRAGSWVESTRYKLCGLDPKDWYIVTDLDQNKPLRISGQELMSDGLNVSIPKESGAVIITYKRISD